MRRLLRPAARLAFPAYACLVATLSPAAAQDPLPVVAVMRTIGGEGAARVNRMFRQALREIGHEDGRTLRIVDHSAADDLARMPSLADKLVSERPAVIVAMGSPAARAVGAATASIPIVAFASLFVETQLVSSLSRPGGNLTGVSLITTELDSKRLSLLAEFVPSARRIAVLRDPAISPPAHIASLKEAAGQLGVALHIVQAEHPGEVGPALRLARSQGAEGVNVLASPMLNSVAGEIAAVAKETGLPTICQWREMAEAGCLLGYGASFLDSYRLLARQVDRVLRGARPADLPVEQPTRFELVLNLRTAKALGIDVPPALLAIADEVIE